ncbi:hypothetical protein VQH23_07570 [Pararoseomonas sp. SCSIO 73927]|uniref:hypothetical protein n=1 Tax=Pararoseomonas sp. SCSIO 73927 TaxID=3114537 RepID=UPI0030CBE6D8
MSAPEALSGMRRGEWTFDRIALAETGWTRGDSPHAILKAVNELPGRPIASPMAVRTKASVMGWGAQPDLGRGPAPILWTEERLALAKEKWEAGVAPLLITADLNRLPGMRFYHHGRVVSEAYRQGWTRLSEAAPAVLPSEPVIVPAELPAADAGEPCTFCGAPTGTEAVHDDNGEAACAPCGAAEIEAQQAEGFLPPPAPPPVVNCITGDRAEAEALLRKGMSGRAVAEDLGLPLGDVARWVGELRERGEVP